jgi:hypothetical protein
MRHAVKGRREKNERREKIERIGSYSLLPRYCKTSWKKGAAVKMVALPPLSASRVPKASKPKPENIVPTRPQLKRRVKECPHLISLARLPKVKSILANLSIPDSTKSKAKSAGANVRKVGNNQNNQKSLMRLLSENTRGVNAMPSN